MNEDEAFIRAIVDNPGDDTPRLVYADWLDDRGDPRGPYLRAEHAFASVPSPKAKKAARKLAKPLDAVWVARVSRPPFGVCCDHLAHPLRPSPEPPATPDELDTAAESLGVSLPEQLRGLLLNYSLGRRSGQSFVLPASGERGELSIDEFVCYIDPDCIDGLVSCELIERTFWARDEYDLGERFVFLAGTECDNDFVVSCRGRDRGAVHLMIGEEMYSDPKAGVTRVAPSVGEFLAMLNPRSWPLTDE